MAKPDGEPFSPDPVVVERLYEASGWRQWSAKQIAAVQAALDMIWDAAMYLDDPPVEIDDLVCGLALAYDADHRPSSNSGSATAESSRTDSSSSFSPMRRCSPEASFRCVLDVPRNGRRDGLARIGASLRVALSA